MRHARTRAITRDTVLLQIGPSGASRMRRETSRVSFLMCPFVSALSSKLATIPRRSDPAGVRSGGGCGPDPRPENDRGPACGRQSQFPALTCTAPPDVTKRAKFAGKTEFAHPTGLGAPSSGVLPCARTTVTRRPSKCPPMSALRRLLASGNTLGIREHSGLRCRRGVPCGCGPSTNEAEPDAALASDPASSTSLAAATLDRCAAPSHRVHPAIVTEFLSAAVAVDPLRLQVSP
jgi:hypothetical protein